jgi:DNA recombination protein RmuC
MPASIKAGEKHEEKLKTLSPSSRSRHAETLHEEGLAKVEKERVDHYAGLREAVELVRTGQGQVRDETRSLVNALRSSPKGARRWGEPKAYATCSNRRLSPYADYRSEVSVDTDDGQLRPDVIVRLPGNRSSTPMLFNAYLDACVGG